MSDILRGGLEKNLPGSTGSQKKSFMVPIATKLIVSFLAIIITGNAVFSIVGISLIGDRVVSEAQERVRTDLNAAREIYRGDLRHIYDVIRLTARRPLLPDILISGSTQQSILDLTNTKEKEGLDVLTLTNQYGTVILRTSNPEVIGDNQSNDEIVSEVLRLQQPISCTQIILSDNLIQESPLLAGKAYFRFIDTPKARPRAQFEETAGMMLKVAAPVFDAQQNLLGVLYGGILINRNFDIVDKIKQTVFQGTKYEGKDIGTATIFQDDVRISTNVKNEDGTRAIGTRVSEEVYDQVVLIGERWTGRAYVVNNWYITAYEPILDVKKDVIGILYVGILEQKYVDIRNRTILSFLAISLIGVVVSILLSYIISRSISTSLKRLVSASKELTRGNLDVVVEKTSNDEIGELAKDFNTMAYALKVRDSQLKEFTTKKIMESERLALVGQLAAGIAHELNNPLQGIVAYSHLLLEKIPDEDPRQSFVQKIVHQANRCRDIIRGLLDFSRQRKPDKTVCNINTILGDCISLVEKQAIFHDIRINKKFNNNLPMIIVDPSQIERVFVNMIINAAQAMEQGGQLDLATRLESGDKFIEIEFSDTGHGIKPENMEKIFDPFFSTKDPGHGVGLGLAISYGIVKEHKGTISVNSVVEKGTTFIVRLPVSTDEKGTDNGN